MSVARTGTKYNIFPFVRETNFYKNHIKRIILKSRPEYTQGLFQK